MSQIHSNHLGNYYVPADCRNGNCVDIGGNTGCFTLKYVDFFKTIHIYEPQTECYDIIKNRTNNFQNIHLFKEAVYHTSNASVNLISHKNLDSGSVAVQSDIINVTEWTDNIIDYNCKTINLEDITERIGGSIDYLKVDCETSEYNFLIDKDLSKIRYMGIELHWQMGKDNFDKLVSHILKFFDNPHNANLSYPNGQNIEVFFQSKTL